MQSLKEDLLAHQAAELKRITELQRAIVEAWEDVRELKRQRGLLNHTIGVKTSLIRGMTKRTKIRKPHHLNRRIAARKLWLQRREEERHARTVTKQAIIEFRKRAGIPPGGVL